jgi:hypothetical protein
MHKTKHAVIKVKDLGALIGYKLGAILFDVRRKYKEEVAADYADCAD